MLLAADRLTPQSGPLAFASRFQACLRLGGRLAASMLLLGAALGLLPGCSSLSAMNLPGPVNDEVVQVDMSRNDVEQALGQNPTSMYRTPAGMYEARYDYVDGPSSWTKIRALVYAAAAVPSLGLSELIFWPIEIQVEKRATLEAQAEYSKDFALATWEVTDERGTVVTSLRSSKFESYALASRPRSGGTATRFLGSEGQGNDAPLLAPASATTQRSRVRFVVGLRDPVRQTALLVDGQRVATDHDGAFTVDKVVPMGESSIELTAVDLEGIEHVQQVSVTRWDPDSTVPSSLLVGTYHALVIGNDAYRSLPPLNTARADAIDVAAELQGRYGYEVEVLLDATRHDIVSALARYRNLLGTDDKLLLYYAGHGIEDESERHGYWLPVDAEADNPSDWVANSDITRHIKAMNAKHVLVVADSCYAGTLTRGILVPDRAPGYLERLASRRSRTVMTSGGIEPVADDGGGSNSIFADALLYQLRSNRGLMEANELFLRVRRQVAENADQTPQFAPIPRADHANGEFLFYVRDQGAD